MPPINWQHKIGHIAVQRTRITLYATDGVTGGTATVTGVTIAAVEM